MVAEGPLGWSATCVRREYRLPCADVLVNVLGIAVSHDVTDQDVGVTLIRGLEDWGRSRGATRVRLVSGEEREAAHVFYKRLRFVHAERQVNFRKHL